MDEHGFQDSLFWENEECTFPNMDELVGRSDKKSNLVGRKRVASSSRDNRGGDVNKEQSDGNDGEPSDHERYLRNERKRRKTMNDMFTILRDLLPQLPPKVDQSTILDEAVKHIKTLQNTLTHLEKQKMGMIEMPTRETVLAPTIPVVFKTWTSPNVTLNVCGYDAHINICCSMKAGLLVSICLVLEKYKIEVLCTHVSSEHNRSMYMIHAQVIGGYECQVKAEEIYKLAVEEIITMCG